MAWRPLQPLHAIERVRLIASFKSILPTKFVRKLAADGEGRRVELGFTSKNIREGKQISFGPMAVNLGGPPDELFGWDWQRVSAANSPVETLVLENQALVYEMSQYTRWQEFMERFGLVGLPTLSEALDVTDLASLSLEYIDRFVFDGDPTKARPDALLINVSSNLHADAACGKELWHFHKGWFEVADGLRLLINQNIDAQDGQGADGIPLRSLQVFTKTELRPGEAGFDFDAIRPHLDVMHKRSVELFAEILIPQMRPRVGLDGE